MDRDRVARWLIGLALISAVLALPSTASGAAFRFGAYRATVADLSDPADVAIRGDGTLLVAEAGRGRIALLAPDGTRRGSFPAAGGRELRRPGGLAVADDGTIFVSDTGNHRVEVFSAAGERIGGWGAYGDEAGAFNEPRGIAVADGRVYVTDVGNQRVQVFDRQGTLLLSFGAPGVAEGAFNRPVDVAVDAGGIFVADADNNRIQRFSLAGAFEQTWGDWGPFGGLLDEPSAILCHAGLVYVTDMRNHRVQIFDRDGVLQEQWGIHALVLHEGAGKVHYPNAIAIAPDGAFGVVCESFENRIQIFEPNLTGDEPQTLTRITANKKQSHFGARLDIDGKLLTICEPENHRIHLFEMSRDIPIVIGTWGDRGTRPGLMIRSAGLEVDLEQRALYLTDTATRLMHEFKLDYDPDAPRAYSRRRARLAKAYDLVALAGRDVSGATWPLEPSALERDADGNFYVVDPRNSMVFVFSPEMRLLRSFGGYGGGPGQFRTPTDIAFDRSGRLVFVVDADNHRVQAFDRDGRFEFAWGSEGTETGAFLRPFGVAAGRDGFVYVTDVAANRVQKFTETGDFVTAWGQLGEDHESFWKPRGIDQDDRMRIFVIDSGNHRAKIFSPDGEWLVTFGTGRAYTNQDQPRDRSGKRTPGIGPESEGEE